MLLSAAAVNATCPAVVDVFTTLQSLKLQLEPLVHVLLADDVPCTLNTEVLAPHVSVVAEPFRVGRVAPVGLSPRIEA
jgi:hypothetical protein